MTNEDPLTPPGARPTPTRRLRPASGGSEGRTRPVRAHGKRDRLRERDDAGTQRPGGLPDQDTATGALCEFGDGSCFPKGTRHRVDQRQAGHGDGESRRAQPERTQNGELDHDGQVYLPDWTGADATAFQYRAVHQGWSYLPWSSERCNGKALENLCNVATGAGCTAPPISAKFYPFWSLSLLFGGIGGHSAGCVWNFGNDQPNTLLDFGKDAQYGVPTWPGTAARSSARQRQIRNSPAAAGASGASAHRGRRPAAGRPGHRPPRPTARSLRALRGQVREQVTGLAVGAAERDPPVGVLVHRARHVLRPPLARGVGQRDADQHGRGPRQVGVERDRELLPATDDGSYPAGRRSSRASTASHWAISAWARRPGSSASGWVSRPSLARMAT